MESELQKVLLIQWNYAWWSAVNKSVKAFELVNEANDLFIITNYHSLIQLKIKMAGSCMSQRPQVYAVIPSYYYSN
jgi:hypothetical protein